VDLIGLIDAVPLSDILKITPTVLIAWLDIQAALDIAHTTREIFLPH
jgi:hypothetical protein